MSVSSFRLALFPLVVSFRFARRLPSVRPSFFFPFSPFPSPFLTPSRPPLLSPQPSSSDHLAQTSTRIDSNSERTHLTNPTLKHSLVLSSRPFPSTPLEQSSQKPRKRGIVVNDMSCESSATATQFSTSVGSSVSTSTSTSVTTIAGTTSTQLITSCLSSSTPTATGNSTDAASPTCVSSTVITSTTVVGGSLDLFLCFSLVNDAYGLTLRICQYCTGPSRDYELLHIIVSGLRSGWPRMASYEFFYYF